MDTIKEFLTDNEIWWAFGAFVATFIALLYSMMKSQKASPPSQTNTNSGSGTQNIQQGGGNTQNIQINNVDGYSQEQYQAEIRAREEPLKKRIEKLEEQDQQNQQNSNDTFELYQKRAELAEVQLALNNIEHAYQEALKRTEELTAELEAFKQLAPDEAQQELLVMAEAALAKGKNDAADQILKTLEGDGNDARSIERQAKLSFIRGGIAKGDFRYGDALAHYTRASNLMNNENFTYLTKVADLADITADYGLVETYAAHMLKAAGGHKEYGANAINWQAGAINAQGRYKEAEPLYRKALEICEAEFGAAHPHTAKAMSNLAMNLKALDRYADAQLLFCKALKIHKRKLGATHFYTALSYNNVAGNLDAQGRYKKAERLYRKALEIREKVLGEAHPDTAQSMNNLAYNLDMQGRYAEAEPLCRKALEMRKAALGAAHPDTASSYNNVAYNLNAQGRYDEAEPYYRKAVQILVERLGSQHPNTKTGIKNYKALLSQLDEDKQAQGAAFLTEVLAGEA